MGGEFIRIWNAPITSQKGPTNHPTSITTFNSSPRLRLRCQTEETIWETRFSENDGSTPYVRTNWLMRRFLMSFHHPKITHWFPFSLVQSTYNGTTQHQQFKDWDALDPRFSYFGVQRLFATGGL